MDIFDTIVKTLTLKTGQYVEITRVYKPIENELTLWVSNSDVEVFTNLDDMLSYIYKKYELTINMLIIRGEND